MPICGQCGEESDHVTKCTTCGDSFCADCGDANKKLCLYCIDDDDEDTDESGDEEGVQVRVYPLCLRASAVPYCARKTKNPKRFEIIFQVIPP